MLSFAETKASKGNAAFGSLWLVDFFMDLKNPFSDLEVAAYTVYSFVRTITLLVTT